VYAGAHAVFRTFALGGSSIPAWAYRYVPGFAFFSEAAYRLVADHRPLFSAITRLLWGRSTQPETYRLSSWLFLRLLGVVYLAAFWSLGTQVIGLIGHSGILPADAYMSAARQWANTNHLDALSRELGVTAGTIGQWRDQFLAGGQAAVKSRPADERDDELGRLRAKIGELTMENELLRERARRAEGDGGPFGRRRSR